MPLKTRAALLLAPGRPLEVHELDVDEPRPDEVVVRMAAVGICGTDLHSYVGEWDRPTPIVLGHEGAGVVGTIEFAGDGASAETEWVALRVEDGRYRVVDRAD